MLLDEHMKCIAHLSPTVQLYSMNLKAIELMKDNALRPIRLISFKEFKFLGTMPRNPDNADLNVNLDSIDRDNSFLVFISHCWLRGYPGAVGYDKRPHPDNSEDDKFKLCVKGIDQAILQFAPKVKNCYVWLDYGCINQDGSPAGELEQLDKIVECCDVIFTPIYDADTSWVMAKSFSNVITEYKAKLWNDGPYAYLNRGWCRVEMFYAANIPILPNSDPNVKRHTLFKAGLAVHCESNRRPHLLYGSKEMKENRPPIMLPPLQNSYLDEFSPEKGCLTKESDREHILALMELLRPYVERNRAKLGYRGQLGENGKPHGRGINTYDNGDVYDGMFDQCKKHGYGVYRFASGNIYEGEYKNDLQHGRGTYRFSSGNVYEGEWADNCMHGQGVYRYSSGAVYEGNYVYDEMEGYGVFRQANGDMYAGMWKADNYHGHGVYTYANGDMFEGEFVDDKKHGRGVMRYADGRVYEGEWRNNKML